MPPKKEHKIINNVEHKQCSKCRTWKTLDRFNKRKRNADGLVCECKECLKKRKKGYYKNNKKRILQKILIYYNNNKEAIIKKISKSQKIYCKTEKGKETRRKAQRKRRKNPKARNKMDIRRITSRHLGSAKNYFCMMCKKQAENFHHFTYDKHFKINTITFCKKCHNKLD